ncbi:MAG: single-stranded DNA-binding protein [bacterium]
MSRTLNKVMLIGNVGNDPEYRLTPNNIPVATFRMATSQVWRDKDGSVKEHTDWHTIVGWRGLAEVINKLVTKGSRLYVEGKIRNRKYDSSSTGKKYAYEIVAESILMLEQRRTMASDSDDDHDSSPEEFIIDDSESATKEPSENVTNGTTPKTVDTFLF